MRSKRQRKLRRGGGDYRPLEGEIRALLGNAETSTLITPDQKKGLEIFINLEQEVLTKYSLSEVPDSHRKHRDSVERFLKKTIEGLAQKIEDFKHEAYAQGFRNEELDTASILGSASSPILVETLTESWKKGRARSPSLSTTKLQLPRDFVNVPLGEPAQALPPVTPPQTPAPGIFDPVKKLFGIAGKRRTRRKRRTRSSRRA
jgi:hypothetical protein